MHITKNEMGSLFKTPEIHVQIFVQILTFIYSFLPGEQEQQDGVENLDPKFLFEGTENGKVVKTKAKEKKGNLKVRASKRLIWKDTETELDPQA